MPSRSEQRRRRILKAAAALLPVAVAIALLVFASTRDSESKTQFEKSSEYWVYARPMPHRRSYTASAKLGGKVYVAGGMVGETGRPLDEVERFDPGRNAWASLPSLPESFSAGAAASLGARVWVVGGNTEGAEDRHGQTSHRVDGRQVYSYGVRAARWRAEPSLPAPRTNLAVVALGRKLYAIGGLDPFYATRTVFVYNPRARRWSNAAPLPKRVQAHAAVAFRGEVWVLGGRNRSGKVVRDVWIYSPRQNRWRRGPSLPKPLETLAADVSGDRIDVVLESTYFIYDRRASRWRRGPSQNVPRHALGVFAIGGFLYSLGGCIVPQLQDSPVVEKISLASATK